MNKTYFVYILECSDKSFYVGVTNNIENRLHQHMISEEISSYVYLRKPFILVYQEQFYNIEEAIYREKQIKKWSRNKKIALIDNDYNKLKCLSKSNT